MKGCFVRGLFGDELVDGYHGLLTDLAARAQDKIKPEPCLWFAWGQQNFDAITAAGFNPIGVCMQTIPNKNFHVKPDYVNQYGAARWGRNIYWLKFNAVYFAMHLGYDAVLWLDMDVELVKPLPADFWETLASGQSIQVPLAQYHRVQCGWRKTYPRTSIYCATAYFRGKRVVERCLELAEQHPLEYEQAAINRAIDELAGGTFPGQEEYKAMGFEFPFTERKGGMIHEPREPLFRIHSKGWSQFKRKGIAAWREHVAEVLKERAKTCEQS